MLSRILAKSPFFVKIFISNSAISSIIGTICLTVHRDMPLFVALQLSSKEPASKNKTVLCSSDWSRRIL